MKKNYRFIAIASALVMVITSASGCGMSAKTESAYEPAYDYVSADAYYDEGYAVEEAEMSMVYMSGSGSGNVNGYAAAPKAAREEMPVPTPTAAEKDTAAAEEGGLTEGQEGAATIQRKLIRNVNVEAQTTEYEKAVEALKAGVLFFDGYIESSNEYGSSYYSRKANRHFNMSARIPADRLDEFLNTSFEDLVITSKSETTRDITLTYTDLEAKVSTLRVEQDRLMELLAEAENIDSIIALESRLSEIRYELESISSSLRVYDNQVAYSTVWINISEVSVVTPAPKAGFLERISSGFKSNLEELGEEIEDKAVIFITNIPRYIVIALNLYVLYIIVKKIAEKLDLADKYADKKAERLQKKKDKAAEKAARKAAKAISKTTGAKASAEALTQNADAQTAQDKTLDNSEEGKA